VSSCPAAASQKRGTLSMLTVASQWPPGLTAAALTAGGFGRRRHMSQHHQVHRRHAHHHPQTQLVRGGPRSP
jgi:hypothetical protein